MATEFELLGPADKPALLAFSTPAWLEASKVACQELGYKVHTAATHTDFLARFSQIRYQIVLLEELFGANSLEENLTLKSLQTMQMSQRRHATIILLGDTVQTYNPLQAFQHSVNSVISSSELFLLNQLIEKSVADTKFFFHTYTETQTSLYRAALGVTAPAE
jgi:hypothetical protein